MAHANGLAWLSVAFLLWLIALQSATSLRIDEDESDVAMPVSEQKTFVSAAASMEQKAFASAVASMVDVSPRKDGDSSVKMETKEKAHSGTVPEDTSNLVPMLVLVAFMFVIMLICAILMYKCMNCGTSGSKEDDDALWPSKLYVTSTIHYDGTYWLVRGAMPNGMPLWKQDGRQNWIFAGEGNQWFIGDEDEEAQGFVCNTGNVASFEEHAGRMPDEIGSGGWLLFNGQEWVDMPKINVTSDVFTLKDQQAITQTMRGREMAATKIQARYRGMTDRRRSSAMSSASASSGPPKTLVVRGAPSYSGIYKLVEDSNVNGFPIWKRRGTQDWIFCGEGGQWLIGDEDEQKQDFKCNTGNIASLEENGGRLPNEFEPGGWLYFDGQEWISDANICIY